MSEALSVKSLQPLGSADHRKHVHDGGTSAERATDQVIMKRFGQHITVSCESEAYAKPNPGAMAPLQVQYYAEALRCRDPRRLL
jgi:hypothetical protein